MTISLATSLCLLIVVAICRVVAWISGKRRCAWCGAVGAWRTRAVSGRRPSRRFPVCARCVHAPGMSL
jgi:hypothetical protein